MRSNWLKKYKTIIIEGPIGVGKTSLTKKMSEIFSISKLLEQADENPFLEKFYSDSQKYALQTQLFFLFQRLEQIGEYAQRDLFKTNIISDFMLEKDPIFASLTLTDAELDLYHKIYHAQNNKILLADLIIYLQANPDQLFHRIKRIGFKMELNISLDYLSKLCSAYNQFFYKYTKSPILIINTTSFNPIDNQKDFTALINQIDNLRGKITFFNSLR